MTFPRNVSSPSSGISYTLKTEEIRSSETSVNTISTRCHIPEDGFLHSHRRGNLKSYIRIWRVLGALSSVIEILISMKLNAIKRGQMIAGSVTTFTSTGTYNGRWNNNFHFTCTFPTFSALQVLVQFPWRLTAAPPPLISHPLLLALLLLSFICLSSPLSLHMASINIHASFHLHWFNSLSFSGNSILSESTI
jgi:hypothetical protein